MQLPQERSRPCANGLSFYRGPIFFVGLEDRYENCCRPVQTLQKPAVRLISFEKPPAPPTMHVMKKSIRGPVRVLFGVVTRLRPAKTAGTVGYLNSQVVLAMPSFQRCEPLEKAHNWVARRNSNPTQDFRSTMHGLHGLMEGTRELYVSNVEVRGDSPSLPVGRRLSKVLKGVFGLADAPREWFLRLRKSLVREKWKTSSMDAATFFLWSQEPTPKLLPNRSK